MLAVVKVEQFPPGFGQQPYIRSAAAYSVADAPVKGVYQAVLLQLLHAAVGGSEGGGWIGVFCEVEALDLP
jgi:hypothetical protein